MLLDPERNLERSIVEEFEQGVLSLGTTPEQMCGLREHRFTNEKGRFESFETLDNPAVVTFCPSEKSNERPGMKDRRHRSRSPKGARQLRHRQELHSL